VRRQLAQRVIDPCLQVGEHAGELFDRHHLCRDLSIAGFDDSEVARIAWPAITTVRQPVFDMAVAAADMVIAQLDGTTPDMCRSHRHELVIRQSTGPAPRPDHLRP
jgi:DNA-binding LacI/PurR family transcriptional regulator